MTAYPNTWRPFQSSYRRITRARRDYRCSGCKGTIAKGTLYMTLGSTPWSDIWPGVWMAMRVCEGCPGLHHAEPETFTRST
jgi:hypothetical protein